MLRLLVVVDVKVGGLEAVAAALVANFIAVAAAAVVAVAGGAGHEARSLQLFWVLLVDVVLLVVVLLWLQEVGFKLEKVQRVVWDEGRCEGQVAIGMSGGIVVVVAVAVGGGVHDFLCLP